MFLHYILQQPLDSLLFQCYQAQMNACLRGDWVSQVEQDLIDLKITGTRSQIQLMSKPVFKDIVKRKASKFAYEQLIAQKEKQSKCKNIEYSEFKIQGYVTTEKLTKQQKKILFQARSGTYPVFTNYRHLHPNPLCPCCQLEDDTVQHQLNCQIQSGNNNSVEPAEENDIYHPNLERQCKVAILLEQAQNRRKKFIEQLV